MKRIAKLTCALLALLMVLSVVAGCELGFLGKATPVELEIEEMPAKLRYTEGETFDSTGMKINFVMDDGTRQACTDYTVTPDGTLGVKNKTVEITSQGLSLKLTITVVPVVEPITEKVEKHLILNADGSYGGTTNLNKYGEGAPLNGELDHEDSVYYRTNDYYNMCSTSSRTILPHYMSYQQTMADSDGLACALAVLKYMGEDVSTQWTEEALLKKYEQLNNTTVYGNGTDAAGLKALFRSIGYYADTNLFQTDTSKAINTEILDFTTWLDEEVLSKGYFLLVRYQDGNGFRWRTVIGMDNMGTLTWGRDDVLILGDPCDRLDHYQDGYQTVSLGRFYRWWENVQLGRANKTHDRQFECVLVKPADQIIIARTTEEQVARQACPEKHLILNADGSYGGTTNKDLYGEGTTANGKYDALYANYHAYVDYYNMTSTDTLAIIPQFRAFQQTMASSCALCSVMVTLNVFGEDITNTYTEIKLVADYEKMFNMIIKGNGTNPNGRHKLLLSYGFECEKNENTKIYAFDGYEGFKTWAEGHIRAGRPFPVSWTPIGQHGVALIGIETMGTDSPYDDVVIIGDSADNWDQYCDGYNTVPALTFYNNWYGGLDSTLAHGEYNIIYPKAK